MKRTISLIITVLLICSLCGVLAVSPEIERKPEAKAAVYEIEITWPCLSFTYSFGKKIWYAQNHTEMMPNAAWVDPDGAGELGATQRNIAIANLSDTALSAAITLADGDAEVAGVTVSCTQEPVALAANGSEGSTGTLSVSVSGAPSSTAALENAVVKKAVITITVPNAE